MTKTVIKDLSTAVEELEGLPLDEPIRVIPTALREYDAKLEELVLVGSARAKPLVWNRIIAIGNLEASDGPVWGIYPSVTDAADWAEVAEIKRLLLKQRAAFIQVEDLSPLKATGIMTAAIALFGEDADGKPVLIIGRHPDLTRGRAVCLLLASILHAEEARAAS